MILQIDHGNHIGTDRCWRQVDDLDPMFLQDPVVFGVGASGGRVKGDLDPLKTGQAGQALHAFVGGCHAHAGGTRQTIGRWVDADHGAHVQMCGIAQDLDHEVSADIAGADNGDIHARAAVAAWALRRLN